MAINGRVKHLRMPFKARLPNEQREIDSFPCRRARTQPPQPEVEREGRLPGAPHVNDG